MWHYGRVLSELPPPFPATVGSGHRGPGLPFPNGLSRPPAQTAGQKARRWAPRRPSRGPALPAPPSWAAGAHATRRGRELPPAGPRDVGGGNGAQRRPPPVTVTARAAAGRAKPTATAASCSTPRNTGAASMRRAVTKLPNADPLRPPCPDAPSTRHCASRGRRNAATAAPPPPDTAANAPSPHTPSGQARPPAALSATLAEAT